MYIMMKVGRINILLVLSEIFYISTDVSVAAYLPDTDLLRDLKII